LLLEELQAYIFALAGAPLTTCKASAAILRDAYMTATWLLSCKKPLPLWLACRCQQWGPALQLLNVLNDIDTFQLGA
jgi:hypothetical protein